MSDLVCALARLDPLQLAWAPGFFDGEGSTFTSQRADRPGYLRLEVTVPQSGHDGLPEVLLRFQSAVLAMGTITGPDDDDMYFWRAGGFQERHGELDDFRWVIERAIGVQEAFMRLRPWLGTVKQEQARRAIDAFLSQTRRHGNEARCVRGHEYDHIYRSATGPKRRCNACARILDRMARARQGIKPRQFRNVARRYTF